MTLLLSNLDANVDGLDKLYLPDPNLQSGVGYGCGSRDGRSAGTNL